MFERFTADARSTVTGAQGHARRLGHRPIGTEHVLRAIVDGSGPAALALGAAGITAATVESDLAARRGAGRDADRRALATIGIDLDAVLAAMDDVETHPVPPSRRRPRWRRWTLRRAPTAPPAAGRAHLPFSPRAKRCLQLALRESLRLNSNSITTEHLLLGILRDGQGGACQILAERGVEPAGLRDDIERRIRRPA